MLFLNQQPKSSISRSEIERIAGNHGLSWSGEYADASYTNDVLVMFDVEKIVYLKFFTDQFCDASAGLKEIDIAKKLISMGIPAPKIISFGTTQDERPRNYAVLESLPGSALCKMQDEDALEVVYQVFSLAQKMQSIRGPSGFFRHDSRVHNTFNTHKGFLEDIMDVGYSHLQRRGFNFAELKNILQPWSIGPDKEDYGLCHNDLTPKHILVRKSIGGIELCGVLDFEWAYFGHKESDYAQWLVACGINGFEKTVEKSYEMVQQDSNPVLLSYYAARQFLVAAVWTHQNVDQPNYTKTCLDKALNIAKNKRIEVKDLIWNGGSPIK